ncbi:MAG: UxaA family hydrolase, partial [Gemmatimonadales bacterium]
MPRRVLHIHPDDDVVVALTDLHAGDSVEYSGGRLELATAIRAKHKVALRDFGVDDPITMYGILVGRATRPIGRGAVLSTDNVRHDATPVDLSAPTRRPWHAPDVSRFTGRMFDGYHRRDGHVGTRNLWLVLPLVFCENRNVRALQEAFDRELGYGAPEAHRLTVRELVRRYRAGEPVDAPLGLPGPAIDTTKRVFPNLDGIRFLTHEGGCGGTRQDTRALCGLLA